MKKEYTTPSAEIEMFIIEDICTTSPGGGMGGGNEGSEENDEF